MTETVHQWSVYDRTAAILDGRKPDRYPFIGRLELWQKGHQHTGTLPQQYQGMALTDIHRDVGFGRQLMLEAYRTRLREVEMVVFHEGEEIQRETDPVLERFPDVRQVTPEDRVGVTLVEFHTARGVLSVEFSALETMLAAGARAYMTKHLITCEDDYPIVEHVLERMEVVTEFERVYERQREFGGDGFVVPTIGRIPFQHLLIDYFDTGDFFFALHDNQAEIGRLLVLLDEQVTQLLQLVSGLDMPYIEFVDNVDGMMTNPRLFERYCMEPYQRYSDIAHGQGKKIGSHMDGNVQPILKQVAESGLDVIESFSPAPLTPLTVETALGVWGDKPLIWGGIPCPLLEADAPLSELEDHVRNLLVKLDRRPIILNVVDMVLPINEIERVRRIAEIVEEHAI
jgi:hypothetical protein